MTLQAGQRVRLRHSPTEIGVLTGKTRERRGLVRHQVQFPDQSRWVPEDQLERIGDEQEHPADLLSRGKLGGAVDLRRTLIHRRLSGRLADVIYSMEATNTDFYPYQFKPVLKLLESPGNALLVADEVGLGKTVEAGLAWTELRSRFDARRLLVICPAALREKWRFELRTKFGVEASIENAQGVLRHLHEQAQERKGFAVITSLQGLRPPRQWEDDLEIGGARAELARLLLDHAESEPLVDLVVFDEAHHMRNPATANHRVGQLARDVAHFRLLLTATPVHNSNRDLHSALRLLDPDTFSEAYALAELLKANEPLVRARDLLLADAATPESLREELETALAHRLLEGNRQLTAILADLPTQSDLAQHEVRSRLAYRLEHVNLLAYSVTRTRKRDVVELKVVRDPQTQVVDMSTAESTFYRGVTALVQDYAAHRGLHEAFLLSTPQRQLSSCMAAALRRWKTRQIQLAESDWDGSEEEAKDKYGLGPLALWLAERAPKLGDIEELEAHDTKFEKLASQLASAFADAPETKVVVFSEFRDTLTYLQRRLTERGIDVIVLMGAQRTAKGAPSVDKQAVIEKFEDPAGPRVLLSSEVGGEGIDLQFSQIVVNYDLPWNPMRLEQRIGRLDRIGQRAEVIRIWNLLHRNTIDERLYECLYDKLDLCRRALGDFEAILGEKMRQLTIDLLTQPLSPQQQRDRIKQTEQALSNLRREQEQLEEQARHLVAYGDYILNQIQSAHQMHRWITAGDVRRYVLDFFEANYRGSDFHQLAAGEPDFDVRLSEEARHDLERFVREQDLTPTRLTDVRTRVVRCRFAHRATGTRRPSFEVITQFHPLVRFVSAKVNEAERQLTPAVSVQVRRSQLPPGLSELPTGTYVAAVSFWSVAGLRTLERLVYSAEGVDGGGQLPPQDAEGLVLAAAQEGTTWVEAGGVLDMETTADTAEQLFERVAEQFATHVDEVRAENEDRADIQARTLERHLRQRGARLEEVLEKHRRLGRTGLARATEGRIQALQERVSRERRNIDARRSVLATDSELLAAVIRVAE